MAGGGTPIKARKWREGGRDGAMAVRVCQAFTTSPTCVPSINPQPSPSASLPGALLSSFSPLHSPASTLSVSPSSSTERSPDGRYFRTSASFEHLHGPIAKVLLLSGHLPGSRSLALASWIVFIQLQLWQHRVFQHEHPLVRLLHVPNVCISVALASNPGQSPSPQAEQAAAHSADDSESPVMPRVPASTPAAPSAPAPGTVHAALPHQPSANTSCLRLSNASSRAHCVHVGAAHASSRSWSLHPAEERTL